MTTVQDLAEEIVAREGGFVNDPADPGGATNHGVTLGTLRHLGLDLTGDGIVTEADVRHLTRAQAVSIFVDHYFRKPGLDGLPESLHASVFDMYVNAGANAVRVLQRLLTRMGFPCADDGVVGPPPARRLALRRKRPRIIWPMPMPLPGAITITGWPMPVPPAGALPGGGTAARAAGSPVPKTSWRTATV
jgi:lysozyme family protein